MGRKEPSSNSNEKGHSSKKNAGETSRRTKKSQRKPSKRIISREESSSDEFVNVDDSPNEQAQLNFCATVGKSSRKESIRTLKTERITRSTSESLKKEYKTKQNVEASSKEEKASKRRISRAESSSDEFVNVEESPNKQAQLNFCATVGKSSRKESIRKLKTERITRSTSEFLKKDYTTKQNVEEASSNEAKAYKRITSREKRFSGEMVKAGSYRAQPYPIHSRASSEGNSRIKASKEEERKRSSYSKSLKKLDFTKKHVEETSQPTQSSIRTSKKIDCCEDNSTEESSTDDNNPTSFGFSSTCGENEGKEWRNYKPLPPIKKNPENDWYKQSDSGEKITFDIFPSFGNKRYARDDRRNVGQFSPESSTSELSPGCGNLSKSGNFKPFNKWANISYKMRYSEPDEEPENDDTGFQDGARARIDPMQTHKAFQKFKYLKIEQDNKEKRRFSRTDHSELQTQEDVFKSITPTVNSTLDMERENDGTEAAGNAFAENSPKVVNKDIAKKEGEKTKDLTSRSEIDDAKCANIISTYGVSNVPIPDLKAYMEKCG